MKRSWWRWLVLALAAAYAILATWSLAGARGESLKALGEVHELKE